MRLLVSQFFNASPERVFAAATDISSWSERITAIERTELLTDGPVGVGTEFRETRIMFKKEATEEMWFTAFEPPASFVLESDSCGSHFTTTHRFIPQRDGTQLELEMVTVGSGLLSILLAPMGWLMAGTMKKMLRKDLEDLARSIDEGS